LIAWNSCSSSSYTLSTIIAMRGSRRLITRDLQPVQARQVDVDQDDVAWCARQA
jgi:hypothetical protein